MLTAIWSNSTHILRDHRAEVEREVKELGSMPQCSKLDFMGQRSTRSWGKSKRTYREKVFETIRPGKRDVVGFNFLGLK